MIPGLLCSKIPARCAKVHGVLKNAITERKKLKKKTAFGCIDCHEYILNG